MIYFPFLYEDELLYSVLARYHLYSGNRNCKTTMDELFGSRTVCSTTLFPTYLQSLCQSLPTTNSYTPIELIAKHTALPYYAPFIPKERSREIARLMTEGAGTSIYMKLGKTASSINSPKYLYCCRECINEDISKSGEAYWHRTHQIEGVKVCPIHHVWLSKTDVPYAERQNKHEFICLEECNLFEKEMNKKDLDFEHLRFIAEQTQYLFANNIAPLGLYNLNEFYITRLQQEGLATVTGRVRWVDFIPEFNQYYSKKLLSNLNCLVDKDAKDTWLHKVLRKPRVSCHPLRHILLLGFLGETISSLSRNVNNNAYYPFGIGNWPCLNKTAKHYQKQVITSCVITRDYKTGLPIGTFTCSCGFVYSRKGPDKTKEDCFRIGRIKEFGKVWNIKLVELSNTDLSLRGKAELLGVDPMTVKKKQESNVRDKVNPEALPAITINKSEYRRIWISLVKKHRNKSITEIRGMRPKVYMWLYRNDKEWLKNHYPDIPKARGGMNKRVHWEERDLAIAKQIKIIAKEILMEDEQIRVSKNEIGRRIDGISLPSLYRNLEKMPKTKRMLDILVEPVEQFQIRRIKNVASSLKQTTPNVKEWELIRVAGLKRKDVEKFKDIIQKGMYGNSQ